MSDKVFTYLDSKNVEHTIEIADGDFEFTQKDKKLYDQKMQTKPTTFFKDAMRRFSKNKSSVVGAWILGIIVLGAIVLPFVLPADISTSHANESKLAPKLFDAGTGWWDGCTNVNHVALDTNWELYNESEGKTVEGMPADYYEPAVVGGAKGVKIDELQYIDAVNAYADGGYVRVNILPGGRAEFRSWDGYNFNVGYGKEYTVNVKTIDPSNMKEWVYGAVAPTYSLYFHWIDETDASVSYDYLLGENIATGSENSFTFDQTKLAELDPDVGVISASTMKPYLYFVLESHETHTNNLLIEKVEFVSSQEAENEELANLSILNANKTLSIIPKGEDGQYNKYYWSTYGGGNQNLYHAKFFTCSFRFDTYEKVFGDKADKTSVDSLKEWANKGWLTADFTISDKIASTPYSQRQALVDQFIATIALTPEGEIHCPLRIDADHPVTGVAKSAGAIVAIEIDGTISGWRKLYPDSSSAPRYLFGTDANGRDLLKLTFSGLRTSLLLGLITAVVTFAFGLVWGAIAGYFGGWTDILMERFTDLLGGVPWIVVMTLAIVRFGSSFGVFVMALCLTGWIGTASLTRTQFYRYKNREYILAARTLGASDFRLIFRHILPNAVGTIVTSSVFMITSVIYSESTIAYLNLGLTGMDSFGVILADNQQYIMTFPHLILFPSFIMLLMMISFNLFGNGLRDAFNPSLKGEE